MRVFQRTEYANAWIHTDVNPWALIVSMNALLSSKSVATTGPLPLPSALAVIDASCPCTPVNASKVLVAVEGDLAREAVAEVEDLVELGPGPVREGEQDQQGQGADAGGTRTVHR